nr:hypothetical protein [Thiothrix nivea]
MRMQMHLDKIVQTDYVRGEFHDYCLRQALVIAIRSDKALFDCLYAAQRLENGFRTPVAATAKADLL